jgi:signal transduction histidine kinase/ligand-binding sensor domain-containing protein/DNA-binding response OmpR family regulator
MERCSKIFCLVIFFPFFLYSQTGNIRFEHFSVEDGLSQSTIYAIYQDSRGFLWLGTADGLNRYDGYKFIVYKHNPDDSLSLGANRIYSILEDKAGDLWIGTYGGGLNKFIRDKEHFIQYKNDPDNPSSLSNDKVLSVFIDRSEIIWIGTEGGGLNRFDITKELFTHYTHLPGNPASLSNNNVRSVYEDNAGVLWIGTGSGLNKFDSKKDKFIHYKNNPHNPFSISDNEILSIYEDKSGNLWIGTGRGGLNKSDSKREKFINYKFNPGNPKSLSANRVFSISEDNSGNLWIGTIGGGLNRFDKEKEQFTKYTFNPENPSSLSSSGVFAVYIDRSEVIWIGTYNGGLNKLDRSKLQFAHFTNNPGNPESLSDKGVYSFCEDKEGDIWIGTGKGLNKFIKEKDIFTQHKLPGYQSSGYHEQILSIYEDKSGRLWIGTYGGGLNLFDKKASKFFSYKHEPGNPNSLSDNRIFAVHEDNSGNLWIGTDGGDVNKLDITQNQFIHYKFNPGSKTGLNANRVFTIYKDKSGVLWFGTDGGGLNKFDKEKNQFVHYIHDPKNPQSLSNNSVFSIYEDKSGNLWIGTYGGGLNKFDRQKGLFKQYRETQGLPNEVIYGILEDGKGNLWLSTNNGLAVFNPLTEEFRNYDTKDGLQSNEFNQGAYLKTRNGSMLFGGIDGFNFFHPDSLKDNTHIPNIVITDFQIFNKPVPISIDKADNPILKVSITETKEIILSYEENVISFELSALDFRTPVKNGYAYFMEGFDKEWSYTDASRRFVTYTNLDPGEYIFRVRGSNNDGVWNEEGTAVKLLITPPWWATWWAYTLYGILFLFSLFAIRKYDMKRQRLKHQLKLEHEHSQKLEELDQIKSRFFTNISHEFRTPLTLILGPAENIISDAIQPDIKNQADLMKKNAIRLLGLINQLLDISKLDEGKLKLLVSKRNIVSFVKGIVMIFESFAESKDINLKVKSVKEDIQVYFDKEKMEKVFINILSNALKFTSEGGNIVVTISETNNDNVMIKVKDSGIGIPAKEIPKLFDRFYQVDSSYTRERGGTGIGLALTKELVELHHGNIKVDSIENKWTEFTLEFPVGKGHLVDDEISEEPKITHDDSAYLYLTEHIDADLTTSSALKDTSESDINSENVEEDKTIILIVEDNAYVREYIRDSLKGSYRVEEASNGEHGVKKAEAIIPDLIISDIMMPKMDGYELTRILKNDEKTNHIPVILLTAKSEQESKYEGLETGADSYLVKPFSTKELQLRIRNLINIRKKLQEKFASGEKLPIRKDGEKLSEVNEKFMNRVTDVLDKHIAEEEFSIEEFGKEIGMSRTQLHRKLKALTGKSASLYMRSYRLTMAKKMIEKQKGNISEIAYSVGFSSPAYFSKCFKEEYGYPPSELIGS